VNGRSTQQREDTANETLQYVIDLGQRRLACLMAKMAWWATVAALTWGVFHGEAVIYWVRVLYRAVRDNAR
jgi:hypothetical protein